MSYLSRDYLRWWREHQDLPRFVLAGADLYDAIERNIIAVERLKGNSGSPYFMYRASYVVNKGRGWRATFG